MRGGTRGSSPWLETGVVGALLLAALALRTYRLDLGWFGVDQARDIATALDIVSGRDLPTIGPTMRRVTRLGALYYYVWSLPYLVSRDPIAGYWFAATLSSLGLLLTWYVARRLWGPLPAVVTLAVGAAHPVWIIDGRIAWAPAALPAASAVLLWLVLDAGHRPVLSVARSIALGAALGVAVQLHLAMAVWVAAAAVVVALDRPPARAWVAGAVAFLALASPAIWAVVAMPDTESGVATLGAENATPSIAARVSAVAALPSNVRTAFSQWDPHVALPGWVTSIGDAAYCVAIAAGLVAIVVAARARERTIRLAALAAVGTLGLVAVVPGAPWYYYLDALLPVWALGTGALVTVLGRRGAPSPVRPIVAALVIAAALLTSASMAAWLGALAHHEYVAVDPALLSLEVRPGRDAAVPGRLLSLGVKRAVAARVAGAESTVSQRTTKTGDERDERRFADLWHRLHGPAWEDATGDNGFWVRAALASSARDAPPARRHFGLWYIDDAVARDVEQQPRSGASTVRVGPIVLVSYDAAIAYDGCRTEGGSATVPVRAVPHPKRYGDGTSPKPAMVPPRLICDVDTRAQSVRVVASSSGPGTVTMATGAHEVDGAITAALCVPRAQDGALLTVGVSVPRQGATALDVYELPLGGDCE